MQVSKCVRCTEFPCQDIDKSCYQIPDIEIKPDIFSALMVSEATPTDLKDYFYSKNNPFYMQTTAQAFNDAGLRVSSIEDILNSGVYITTAIKCGKIGYFISPKSVSNCSRILETEINLFPNVRSILLMGDTAIKAMNCISERNVGKRIIPSGSTYKIRRNQYFYKQSRVFPSYLQTGKSYLIEKSKRKMIAEDIKAALEHH